ncbi:SDR family oxidoreductase [Nocardia wallacei]|uniref:SDR family oxidoreductase n=1 Tax=Nocardia wallacei TaxID=480035 RepID=UPI0024537864|nr:NmrA family NAD(P)-binding protein [Nocardia wallacei]
MTVLVLGGTGTVGAHVVQELLARRKSVRVLSRRPSARTALPDQVDLVVGDLLDPSTAAPAFDGVRAVFLLNAVSPTESHEALTALNLARQAGVNRIVYASVQAADQAPHIPHYGSKLGVEAAIESSPIPFTILRPNNFFQNDYWAREPMLTYGVYNQPIGSAGLSRVDARDIAEAAAIALTSPGHEGKHYDLVGPDVLTGDATAAVWSKALGRPISYAGDDLTTWQHNSASTLPAWMAFDLATMYEYFQRDGLIATPDAIDTLTDLLGRSPRSLAQFAAETANEWHARPSSSDRTSG